MYLNNMNKIKGMRNLEVWVTGILGGRENGVGGPWVEGRLPLRTRPLRLCPGCPFVFQSP